jgi:hypothetical protein
MAQIFRPYVNVIARASILGFAFLAAAVGGVAWLYSRSAYQTQVGVVRPQPVQFSHEHHVAGLGIDCRYCHTSVETSPFAGIPPTEICMQCHAQIWRDSPELEPVRNSFRTGEPLRWTRVHDVPDFVYFDHSIHVAKGVGCASCHGPVDEMPLMWRVETLHMQWCLDCHRHPAPHIRPADQVFSMEPVHVIQEDGAQEDGIDGREALLAHYQITSETDCSTCHR